MATHDTRQGTWFERNAWMVFTGLSVILIAFGLGDLASGGSTYSLGETVLFNRLTGTTWAALLSTDPGAAALIDHQVRTGGTDLAIVGVLNLAVSITAFRRGERWAWIAMWVWPPSLAVLMALVWTSMQGSGTGIPVPMISGSILFLITLATLLLSARRYLAHRGP
jgi:hypothetical protein